MWFITSDSDNKNAVSLSRVLHFWDTHRLWAILDFFTTVIFDEYAMNEENEDAHRTNCSTTRYLPKLRSIEGRGVLVVSCFVLWRFQVQVSIRILVTLSTVLWFSRKINQTMPHPLLYIAQNSTLVYLLLTYLNDNGYWVSFLAVKRPARGVDHPIQSNNEIH